MPTKRIAVTDRQRRFVKENWGSMTAHNIAEAIGLSRTMVGRVARDLDLPLLIKSGPSHRWSEADLAIFRQALHDGMGPGEIRMKFFPHRTYDAMKRMARIIRTTPPTKLTSVEVFAPKQAGLEPLQYTLDDCPRVTLAEACQWMRQAKKGWVQPADDRRAWLEINHQRLFGPIPVPPFLPDRRPVHDDNARIVQRSMPEWRLGANG